MDLTRGRKSRDGGAAREDICASTASVRAERAHSQCHTASGDLEGQITDLEGQGSEQNHVKTCFHLPSSAAV